MVDADQSGYMCGALIGHTQFTLQTSTEARLAPGASFVQLCTNSQGIDKQKKLVKMMKQVKIQKPVIMRLKSVPGSREN